jgi:FixJ family two-component response regulator
MHLNSAAAWTRRPSVIVSDICPMSAVPIVFIVDDDVSVRESLELLIQGAGCRAETFASAEEFLSRPRVLTPSCLILDVMLPDLNGLDLQERIAAERVDMPIIFVTEAHDISTTVRAMKAGAAEFLTKPCDYDVLLSAIRHAVDRSSSVLRQEAEMEELRYRYASLTPREREVMDLVVIGELNKQVGGELGISEITVKAHRGNMMRKMKACSLVDLVNMAARLRPPSVPKSLTLDGPAVLEGHRGGGMTSQLIHESTVSTGISYE